MQTMINNDLTTHNSTQSNFVFAHKVLKHEIIVQASNVFTQKDGKTTHNVTQIVLKQTFLLK